jgi:hypothetical protein
MSEDTDEVREPIDDIEVPMNARQLRAFRYGLGARIMPVNKGWRVDFFSVPDFEQESGTDYPSLQEAVETVMEWLPRVNTEEEREKARLMEELLRLRLQENLQAEELPEPTDE